MTHRFLRLEPVPALLALAIAACGGSQAKPEDPGAIESLLKAPPSASPSVEDMPPASNKGANNDKPEDLNDTQKAQMEIALRRGGDKAAKCADVVPGSAKGEGEVKVTFNGKKGRATDVQVGPPWAGTDAESCIKRAFVGEIVVPFDGELEVPYTVKLGPKGGDADKGKGDKGKPKPQKK